MVVHISEVLVHEGRRELIPEYVRELADSISAVGLLNPITIDRDQALISGLHRLEAAKLLGWAEIECTVSNLEGLLVELAEVDENVVRKDLSAMEFSDLLLRRKRIYEALHPEIRHGGDRKSEKIKTKNLRLDPVKSFAQDTAEKLGVSPRTVELQVQTARDLTPEAKDIIRNAGRKITKQSALQISRLEPEQQKEAASQLAAGQIRSMKEYQPIPVSSPREPSRQQAKAEPDVPGQPVVPPAPGTGRFSTFAENAADLKDPNKDCSCTPDTFVAEFSAYMRSFTHGIKWYAAPDYSVVFPSLSQSQIDYLRELAVSVCDTVNNIFHQIERSTQE